MDLKQLREEALNEANTELQDEKKYEFKQTVKNIVNQIGHNLDRIAELQKENKKLQDELKELEIEKAREIKL